MVRSNVPLLATIAPMAGIVYWLSWAKCVHLGVR